MHESRRTTCRPLIRCVSLLSRQTCTTAEHHACLGYKYLISPWSVTCCPGKSIETRFNGDVRFSDGGLLALRPVGPRLGIVQCLTICIDDPRMLGPVVRGLDEIPGFRILMIAVGYEDGNDVGWLRRDPVASNGEPARVSGSVLAGDDLALNEAARTPRATAHGHGDGRALLLKFPQSAEQHCARHRRYLRCRQRRTTTLLVHFGYALGAWHPNRPLHARTAPSNATAREFTLSTRKPTIR